MAKNKQQYQQLHALMAPHAWLAHAVLITRCLRLLLELVDPEAALRWLRAPPSSERRCWPRALAISPAFTRSIHRSSGTEVELSMDFSPPSVPPAPNGLDSRWPWGSSLPSCCWLSVGLGMPPPDRPHRHK